MRNFVALSQEIVRKLSQREQLVFIDFISRAFIAAQRNGVEYLQNVTFELHPLPGDDVDADGVSNSGVKRAAGELLKILPSPAEVAAAVEAKGNTVTTAEIASGLKEGVIGTTAGAQPVHVHNEVSGISPLDDAALSEAADRALAKVQASTARDPEILPAIGEVKAADAAAAVVGIVPATADAPVPVLTTEEAAIVAEVTGNHGEAAGADVAQTITQAKTETTPVVVTEQVEVPDVNVPDLNKDDLQDGEGEEEEEEPAPVGANSAPVPVVSDTTSSAAKPAPTKKPAPKPAPTKKK